MSDTPRTDAEVKAYNCARIDFARQLERENVKLRQLVEECRPYVLASDKEGSAQLYSRLIFNGPL